MEETKALLDEMLQRENMLNALRRVQQNAGAAGVDGMTVDELEAYLREQKLQADKEVEQIYSDARRKADAIEQGARASARQVEDDARVRKERLREEARLIEERIQWAKDGLAEVDERLQQVFLDEPALSSDSDS